MSRGRPTGYKMSDEAKQLCSKSHEDRTNYYTRKVVINGVVYNSVKSAAIAHNVSKSTVVYRIKNLYNTKSFEGWKYL